VSDLAVDFVTDTPNPILPNMFVRWLIMPKKWCIDNKAERPVDKRKGIENAASFKANGTGPFRVKSRDPGNRTVLVRNGTYWDKVETNIDEVVFTPIANPSTRVAALMSGEIDMMEPVPVQDVARINASPSATVLQGPELRTIFLGMDQKRDELLFSSVKGKNPFKDKRVRQAFYQALDIEAIKNQVMRGAATPTALMEAPGVAGFPADLNKRLPYDVEGAKKLMADAGYPQGFEVGMNCPNDRYVNDADICQAVASMLARIGVKVNLNAMPRATYFPKMQRLETSFCMLGWGGATTDAIFTLQPVLHSRNDKGDGDYNWGNYKDPEFDKLIDDAKGDTDMKRRQETINKAMLRFHENVYMIPLHLQVIPWASRANTEVIHRADNWLQATWVKMK
jgi:peptide/nickel transport system substrate-binding protein